MTIDYSDAILGEETLKVASDRPIKLSISIHYDPQQQLVRVVMADEETGNDAHRAVSNGMVRADYSARIPTKSIYEVLPSMTEEIVIMNRMLGHTVAQKEEE